MKPVASCLTYQLGIDCGWGGRPILACRVALSRMCSDMSSRNCLDGDGQPRGGLRGPTV